MFLEVNTFKEHDLITRSPEIGKLFELGIITISLNTSFIINNLT